VIVAVLLAAPGAAPAIDVKTALDKLRFPADTQVKVENGQFVEVALPATSERDLNVGIAFLVKQSPEVLARTVRVEKRLLRADPNTIAYGDFEGNGSAAQLNGLKLTPAQLKAYSDATPGENLNLSAGEISTLNAAGKDAVAVQEGVHSLLLARYRAYRSKGLAGIAPYAREASSTNAAEDLVKVNRAARATNVLSTKLYDLLDNYPQSRPPDLDENLYWAQFTAHGEDTVALIHVFQATFDGTVMIVQRHYYVSTGYNAEQAIVGFLPVGEGTLVIYTNHTSTDQVAGFGGSAKRAIGRKFMAGELEKLFEKTRAGFDR
jgi:hypothetical protein